MEHPSRQRLPEVRRSVGRRPATVNPATGALVRQRNGPTQGNCPALNVAISSP
jgi:hypothetical protein